MNIHAFQLLLKLTFQLKVEIFLPPFAGAALAKTRVVCARIGMALIRHSTIHKVSDKKTGKNSSSSFHDEHFPRSRPADRSFFIFIHGKIDTAEYGLSAQTRNVYRVAFSLALEHASDPLTARCLPTRYSACTTVNSLNATALWRLLTCKKRYTIHK